jgi:hypothetical protein
MKAKLKISAIALVELIVAVSLYVVFAPFLLRIGLRMSMESWVGICIVIVVAHFAKMYRQVEGKAAANNNLHDQRH